MKGAEHDMMISPESFFKENLKGKDADQISSTIRGLKNRIGHLKNMMENPQYGLETIICPSESTRLWYTRLYLERAKVALAEAGGVYTFSQAELKAKKFEDSISEISKIIFTIGGFFGGFEKRTILLEDTKVKMTISHLPAIEPQEKILLPMKKSDFLYEFKQLYIGEWRKSYTTERFGYTILDGTQWNLEIEFSNEMKTFKSGGDNSFPYNFDEFQKLLGIDVDE